MADQLSELEGLISIESAAKVESEVIFKATEEAKERIITSLTTKLLKMDKRIDKETEKLNRILDKQRSSTNDQDRIEAIQGRSNVCFYQQRGYRCGIKRGRKL
jgi:hypothetical protein